MIETDAQWAARVDAQGRARVAAMTLAQAVDLLRAEPFACACVGPPWCCRYAFGQAQALLQAAHITIKMVADTIGSEGALG
jgi:hypothetical protein